MNWTRPKELGRVLLVTVRHVRDWIEVGMDLALTTVMPTRTRTSLVAVRVMRPRDGIRACGFVERL